MTTLTLIGLFLAALAAGAVFRVRHIERQAGVAPHHRTLIAALDQQPPPRMVVHWVRRERPVPLTPAPVARARGICPLGYEGDDCCRSCAIEPRLVGGP